MKSIKGYVAETEIDGYRIVQFGTDDNQVKTSTDKTQPGFGVVGQRGAMPGEHVSVTECGEEFVRIGAAINAGDKFTTDSVGRAIPLAATSGQEVHYIGVMKQTSTNVDAVLRCNVFPGIYKG